MSVEDDGVTETRNWPELVTSIYSEISGDGSTTVALREMDIEVPSSTGENAERAHWTVDGVIELNPDEE
jgi:hypothetical protein